MQQKYNVGDRVVVINTGTEHDGKSLIVGLIHLHTGGYLLIDESGDSVVSVDEKNIRSAREMAKVSVEIEIPDGHEVVRGPTLEWSGPVIVEAARLDDKRRTTGFSVITRPAKPLIICGQPAEWPEWLDCGWVAKRLDGKVRGFHVVEPKILNGKWCGERGWEGFAIECVDIDIPGPWEQSKRENPRRKK